MQIKLLPQKKQSKYKNKKCIVNNITFPSIREARRYVVLYHKLQAGEIYKLTLQQPYKIIINGQLLCTYKADFTYYNKAGALVVEDAKGMKTPVYNLKKRLLFLMLGIQITEV